MDKKIYKKLNNSFNKEYIFHVGAEGGLYSEINNMIFSVLYCLQYGYRFKLYSKDANFGFKKGWEDYFLPFCTESKSSWHHHFNKRTSAPVFSRSDIIKRVLYKSYRKLFTRTSLTFDLWNDFFSYKFSDEHFDIASLGIKGNANHACNQLIKIIYQFNPQTLKEIDAYRIKLQLPNEYISFQIRRGDKNTEKEYVPVEKYFDYIIENCNTKNIFILADDYGSIVEASKKYPQYNIFTLAVPNDCGYIHADFIKLGNTEKKGKIVRLLASIEIMREANIILGVFTANTEMFLGMAEPEKMVWLDGQEWGILGKKKEGLTSDMIEFLKNK